MKYAIYDKAANGYLTKMGFEIGYSEHTQFECGLNEYIIKAELLDTKEAANLAITRIEGFECMEKRRFVVHSFDDELADQYIISEAGNPVKVVNNITVDLSGTINVKYGTIFLLRKRANLIHAITRLNALQKAASDVYEPWRNSFDVYKVITVIDERKHTHYQFIKVTDEELDSAKEDDKVVSFNTRIEELEKANYDLGEQIVVRGDIANRLQEENNNLKAKVESIKKEAHNWKTMYESADEHRMILKDIIDTIYTDLKSATVCDDLKSTLKALSHNSDLDHIVMPTKVGYVFDNGNCFTAKDEVCAIIDQIITIMESRELNQSVAFSAAENIKIAKNIAEKIILICEADDKFDITLKKFSELYKAVNTIHDCNNDSILYAFSSVLEIFTAFESTVKNIIDENVTWKNEAMKAAKDLNDQEKLNKANSDTITELMRMLKEISEVIYAIKNAVYDNNTGALDCIKNRMYYSFGSDYFTRDMNDIRTNILDICAYEKKNIANHKLKNSEITKAADALKKVNDKNEGLTNILKEIIDYVADIMLATRTTDYDKMISDLTDVSLKIGVKTIDDGPMYGISVTLTILIKILRERNSLFALKNNYKRMANSIYGMTIPCRCNGKQMYADITTGKKILIDKEKYDDLMECVNDINLTYEMMKIIPFSTERPTWLPGVINRISNLTK